MNNVAPTQRIHRRPRRENAGGDRPSHPCGDSALDSARRARWGKRLGWSRRSQTFRNFEMPLLVSDLVWRAAIVVLRVGVGAVFQQ